MGKGIPGSSVTVVDDDGNSVPANTKGNIAVPLDLPALFKGYYKEPERTAKAQTGKYYITGDLAHVDDDGYFWFEGRRDDIIISSGYTIGPFEVEDALTNHPAVKECAVVAKPHDIRGNIVKAFVILQDHTAGDDTLVKELQQFVKNEVAPYKYPREIEFVDDLPKTNSGKIRRVELRDAEIEKWEKQKITIKKHSEAVQCVWYDDTHWTVLFIYDVLCRLVINIKISLETSATTIKNEKI